MAHRSKGKLVTARLVVACVILGGLPPARAAGGGGKGGPSLISLALDGREADGASFTPAISADGRWVAFASSASTLVAGDTNGAEDVFVYDRLGRTTERVSLSSAGEQGNGDSFGPAISADGSSVAFESFSSRLVPDDTNGALDVFVADLPTGNISRVSLATDGGQADDRSYSPSISANGRVVAFASFANNLVPDDTNGLLDVFVRRRDQQTTTRLSVGPGGVQSNGLSFAPVISADGTRVAFSSEASNLVPDDTNGIRDVFVASTVSAVVTRLSRGPGNKGQGNGPSLGPVVDASGALVAFASFATNLVAGDTNGQSDVFVAPSPVLKSPGGHRRTHR